MWGLVPGFQLSQKVPKMPTDDHVRQPEDAAEFLGFDLVPWSKQPNPTTTDLDGRARPGADRAPAACADRAPAPCGPPTGTAQKMEDSIIARGML
jgi:hypothetical protein